VNHRPTKPFSAPPFALAHPGDDPSVLTLPVPGYRQARNYSCGFASTLMVLRHFESDLSGQALFNALGTARDGTGQSAIVRVLRSQGLRANLRYDMTFERMAACLRMGKVLIGYLGDEEHWIVLYGFGFQPKRIFVADPEPEKTCEQPWDSYGSRLGEFSIVCSLASEPATDLPQQLCFAFGSDS